MEKNDLSNPTNISDQQVARLEIMGLEAAISKKKFEYRTKYGLTQEEKIQRRINIVVIIVGIIVIGAILYRSFNPAVTS